MLNPKTIPMKKITFIVILLCVVLAAGAQKRPKAIVKQEKQLVGEFVTIPAGHYTEYIDDQDGKVISKKEYTFSSFYMLSSEVTNKAYNTFLEDLKAQGRITDYEVARVHEEHFKQDTLPYFKHPAYALYPVVEVNYEGALLFCQWLNEKLGDSGYEYMLPTKVQWQYAAHGGYPLATYSWGGPYLTNHNGYPMGNYRNVGDERITMKDGVFTVLTDPFFNNLYGGRDMTFWIQQALSFHPNPYGLYNMCGNVAEMVYGESVALGGSFADPGYDIRIQSEKPYTGPSPMIGFRVIAVPKNR